MSGFRRYGGLNYSSKNNVIHSFISNSEQMNINKFSGQNESHEIFKSDIDLNRNSILHTKSIQYLDGTIQVTAAGNTGATGYQGATGAQGYQGVPGFSASFYNYIADTSTVFPIQPSSGKIQWGNSTQPNSTTIYISYFDNALVPTDISFLLNTKQVLHHLFY